MPDVLITEFMDEAAVARLAARFDTLYDPDLHADDARLCALLAEARALVVRNRTQVRGALLAAGGRLRVVGRLGVGLDNIDVEACRARGIEVIPATGANVRAVAEYVITGVLMLLRGAYHSSAAVAAGEWPRERLMGREVGGRVLGLVGFGAIARATAALAGALGMQVHAFDPHLAEDDPAWSALGVTRTTLESLLESSDAVSLHVPLNDATRHLLDAPALARMKPGAVLVNAARGGVLDEAALAAALHAGRLGGALIDVYEHEPLAAGSVLAGVPNLVLTPHVAGVSADSNVRVGMLIAERVSAALEGQS